MAKLTVPTPMAGKLGDQVYARNRQGTGIRARVTPLNPQTVAQQTQRGILAAVASEWRGLTQPQRDAWESLAAQLPGNLSAFNAFVQVNATLITIGMPAVQAPPALPAFGIMTFPQPFTVTHAQAAPHALAINLPVINTVAPDAYLYEATIPPSTPRSCCNPLRGMATRFLTARATACYCPLTVCAAPTAHSRCWSSTST